ncbi:RRXRR domain-containing protein, partial [Clostridium botulinum]
MVYVIDINGNPLMPTNEAKARKLLKNKKAIVKELKPFTIQLNYETSNYTQRITLG